MATGEINVAWGNEFLEKAQDRNKMWRVSANESKAYSFNSIFNRITPVNMMYINDLGLATPLTVNYYIKLEDAEEYDVLPIVGTITLNNGIYKIKAVGVYEDISREVEIFVGIKFFVQINLSSIETVLYYNGEEQDVESLFSVSPKDIVYQVTYSKNGVIVDSVKEVGEYIVEITTQETELYFEGYTNFIVKIKKRIPQIILSENNIERYYDGQNHYISDIVNVTVEPNTLTPSFDPEIIGQAGEYSVQISTPETDFYDAHSEILYVKILKYQPEYTLESESVTLYFDGLNHYVPDLFEYNIITQGLTVNFNPETVKDVGKYEIEMTINGNDYYESTKIYLSLDIIKKTPVFKISENSLTLNYTGQRQNLTDKLKISVEPENIDFYFSRKTVTETGEYDIDVYTKENRYYYAAKTTLKVKVLRVPNLIEHEDVLKNLKNSFLQLMNDDYHYYKNYKIVIAREQEFIKLKQAEPKTIYIVVKFGSASINFSQTVLPITLTAMSEQNKLDVCQKLLSDFVNRYNLETNDDSTIRQIYELPVVTSNFNKVFEGFRSVLFVNGYFVISKNANFYELQLLKKDIDLDYDEKVVKIVNIDNTIFLNKINFELGTYFFYTRNNKWEVERDSVVVDVIENINDYGIDVILENPNKGAFTIFVYDMWEDIPLLSFNITADFHLDSQPFFDVSNFTKSRAKYGVLSFNINTYMLNDIQLVNYAMEMALKKRSIDAVFTLKIKLKNGLELIDNFKLLTANAQQSIAEIPVISLGFTN